MNGGSMANNTIFTDLHVIAYLKRTNDTVFIDVNIVSYGHLCVLKLALLLHVGRPYDALFPDNCKSTHSNTCEVTSQN